MKTKLIILGLLISCAGFGQVYSLDGGTGTATVDTTNEIATKYYVDSIASEIVAGELDLTGYLEWGDTLTKVATQNDIIDLITLGDLTDYLLAADTASLSSRIDSKQATLISGTNIKTINSQSLLGSGDIAIEGTGGGTVTSIALSAPTGLTVSGSPVTTSGTLGLSFTSGYSIPTDANQSNWSTAYGWGNHASAGYASNADIHDSIANMTLGMDEVTDADSIVTVKDGTLSILPLSINDIQMKADTIQIFTFGLGGGLAADTAAFNDNAIAGSFYNSGSDTIHVTSLRGVLAEGSGTETVDVQVSWHATFKSGSATNLNSSALTITSITTGDVDASFANSVVPPGVWVWCTISGVSAGNKPSLLILQLSGYKVPTY